MDKLSQKRRWNQKISSFIITNTESFFYRLGFIVGSKPKTTILTILIVVLVSCAGILRFYQEKNPIKLWVPQQSSFVRHSEWLMKTFEKGFRMEAAILEAPDVLTPEVFQELAKIDKGIKNLIAPRGHKYKNLCFSVPKISPTDELHTKIKFTCDLLDFLDVTCLEQNILELWDYKPKEIESITKEDILVHVNKYKRHPIFSNFVIYEDLLGGIVRNDSGHIIRATHLHTIWLLAVNFSAIDTLHAGTAVGSAEFATEETLEWESTYLDYMKKVQNELSQSKMVYYAARSFGDISNSAMFQDYQILVFAVFIVTFYVYLVVSKCNWVEGRIFITFITFTTIALAFVVGCNISFTIGIPCGPVHMSLPFLLLGIGTDDIFVILSSLDQLTDEQRKLPIHERTAMTLKHAGVSILITTFTDVASFLVGATTVLPSLRSYCIFAAFCLAVTFIFTCTFFVACLTFDMRRQDDGRNCCFPCIKHRNYRKNECSQKDYVKKGFEYVYSRIILTWPGKLLVMLIMVVLIGISIQGVLNLEQKFDPSWFIPSHTYMSKYINVRKEMYPYLGYEATLYIGAVNYTHEFKNIRILSDSLGSYNDIVYTYNSWVPEYQKFVLELHKKDIYDVVLPENDFQLYLSEFLFGNGSKFQQNFKFARELKCGEAVPQIEAAGIDFRFRLFSKPKEHLIAMRKILDLADGANLTTGDKRVFVWSIVFSAWIPEEIIDVEVARNLALALVCVMTCTAILVADLRTCFWIFISVLLTMLNVTGFMQLWGITIDIISCIALQLAIGFCVDYATHIGYTFLTIPGDNCSKRSLKTVTVIGPAVLYGGLSTLIAVLLLSGSEAYAFQVFFKLFLMVTTFGLFNGLILLPVILSWFGSSPYNSHKPLQQNDLAMY